MRKLIYTLMLLLPLSACTRQHTFDTVLAEADQLIESNPDSAYRLLNTIDDIRLLGNDESRALHTLLQAKACWKLYKPGPTDSLMSATVSHYRQQDNQPRLADALYYQAMPLYEAGRHEQALQLLKQGEEIAVNLQDTLLLSKYYESLYGVNYKAQYDSLALHYAKLFLDNSLLRKDTSCIARGYSHISTSLIRLGHLESARKNIFKAEQHLKNVSNADKAAILTNIGCSFRRSNNNDVAKQYFLASLEVAPRSNTYCALAELYANEGDSEEAIHYWELANKESTPMSRERAYRDQYNYYKSVGLFSKALTCYEQMVSISDSLTNASEKEKIAEIQLKYDRTVAENEKQRLLIYLLISALLLIAILSGLWKYHKQTIKKYESSIKEEAEQIKTLEQEIKEAEKRGEEYSDQIENLKDKLSTARQTVNKRLGRGMEIYEAVMKGEKMPSLTGDDRCFIEYYSIKEYKHYQLLREKYFDLSPRPMLYAIFHDLGKTDEEIINILNIKKDSLRSLKKRLADKSRTAKIV